MPLGQKEFENQPQIQISTQDALNAAWTKIGQLSFQIDILMKQLQAFEQQNNELQKKLDELTAPTNAKPDAT